MLIRAYKQTTASKGIQTHDLSDTAHTLPDKVLIFTQSLSHRGYLAFVTFEPKMCSLMCCKRCFYSELFVAFRTLVRTLLGVRSNVTNQVAGFLKLLITNVSCLSR